MVTYVCHATIFLVDRLICLPHITYYISYICISLECTIYLYEKALHNVFYCDKRI